MSEFSSVYVPDDEGVAFRVVRLTDGLGFGDGSISRIEREALPGHEDLAQVTDAAIRSPRILVPVGRHDNGEIIRDDGCIDGRPVDDGPGAIVRGGQILGTSLHRPKVAGGGVTMTAATRIGLGLAGRDSLETIFDKAVKQLEEVGMEHGGHIDGHAHGDNCGCGAIDRAPENVEAVRRHRPEIVKTIGAIAGSAPELEVQDFPGHTELGVMDQYELVSGLLRQRYAGRAVMSRIMETDAVVKRLTENHRETRIVWNQVRGYTVDQSYVRQQTDGRAQVFAVDEWRMHDIAELYRNPADQRRAYLSQVVYTLGVAAVLTKGDLPVDVLTGA